MYIKSDCEPVRNSTSKGEETIVEQSKEKSVRENKVKNKVEIYPLKRPQHETARTSTGNKTLGVSHPHVIDKSQFWIQNESRHERTRNIEKLCHDYPLITKHTKVHGTFYNNYTVFYCGIPKVGSTFLGTFMPTIFNCSNEYSTSFRGAHKNVSRGEYNVSKQLINQAYALMFVREPYHRLFSAYENKLFHPNEFWRILGVRVIEEVRRNATNLSKQLGHDVSFAELVEYVVINHEKGVSINSHLTPMHTICDPCSINFDFIGRLETMSDDIEYIVDEWKFKGIISKNNKPARTLEKEVQYKRSFGRIGHMFRRLHKHKSQVSRYKLFQRTWSSYQISGLILKDYKMPFLRKEVGNINEGKYKLAVKKALNESENYVKELKSQREEAFIQAYSSVPMDLLFRLREFMKPDCLLFGYDDKPEIIFNRKNLIRSRSFTYFKGMK
ncbi:carbohydrate sulfotransferase 8-like [Mercenaria mercenaria]|uniref:carbohydrate sulfotransferase 8-like n=1 Tax=Mercenaria mercenaria TaxID=6596 RepID=UPI00234E6B09|nr:carbohydrate sulfotransferase 8-like [Mercenaria mercenaria]